MSVTFRVSGISETIATLGALEVSALARAAIVTQKAGKDCERLAKNLSPVDTGRLKSSIESHSTGPYSVSVQGHTEYQVFLEFGTRHMAPRAHMYPALDIVASSYQAALRSLL